MRSVEGGDNLDVVDSDTCTMDSCAGGPLDYSLDCNFDNAGGSIDCTFQTEARA